MSAPGVLLTGVGKRYDIVSAFAQHATTVAADPNPLAPAQYAAHVRTVRQFILYRCEDPHLADQLTARAFLRAWELFGWRPTTEFPEGLKAQVEWHQKHACS